MSALSRNGKDNLSTRKDTSLDLYQVLAVSIYMYFTGDTGGAG